MKGLPLSLYLQVVRLLFAWLAWELLLLFDLQRGLPMSHGDLLLVQGQGMWGKCCFATSTLLTSLHRGFWHLHMGQKDKKTVKITPHMAQVHTYMALDIIANKHLLLLTKLNFA